MPLYDLKDFMDLLMKNAEASEATNTNFNETREKISTFDSVFRQ